MNYLRSINARLEQLSKISIKYGIILVKFIYSEKATKLCKLFTLLLTVCTVVNSKVKISQNFVAFSEYMNFKRSKHEEDFFKFCMFLRKSELYDVKRTQDS